MFKWQLTYLLRNVSVHLQSAGNELGGEIVAKGTEILPWIGPRDKRESP